MPSSSLGGDTKGLHASAGFFIVQACKILYRLCASILWSNATVEQSVFSVLRCGVFEQKAVLMCNTALKCEPKTQMFVKWWTKTKK